MENGKSAIACKLRNGVGFGSTEFHVVRAGAETHPEWLHLILRSQQVRDDAENAMHGAAGQQRVPIEFLEQLRIPVPPLAQQRRIVARVEALTSRLNQARQARQAAIADTATLMKNTINAMFPEADCWKTIRDAVSIKKGSVRNGPFGSQLLHHEFMRSGVAAIGTRDVQTNRFDLRSGWFVSQEKFEQFRRYQVFSGDVLCTIVGASIGRFCVVPRGVPLAFTTKHIQALTLNLDVAVPVFVSFMLNFHSRCRDSLFSQVEGSAQPSLNATKVLDTELPLPPLAEQRTIVAKLDAMAAKLDELQRLQREVETELASFTPALLAKAFRGEL
jgi:type I restriction enzyme S subunit